MFRFIRVPPVCIAACAVFSTTAVSQTTVETTPPSATGQPIAEIYPGTGALLGAPEARPEAATEGEADITLNFANADIRDVAKAILDDYLGLNYEIAGDVQGTVTIQTSQPLTRAQVLPVLEQVLQMNGLALVQTNGLYRVIAISNARSVAGAALGPGVNRSAFGYGIEVVPIRFASVTELAALLEPLSPVAGAIHVDATRNLLIIEGTAEQRQTLRDNIALFDADWLSGMSYALYSPNYTSAEDLMSELEQILGAVISTGGTGGVVRLVPINRLNMILAISSQRGYLDQLASWVARLDRPGEGTEKRLFVYRVQNGRAADLAATILAALSGIEQSTEDAPQAIVGPEADLPPIPGPAGGGISISGIGSVNITADEPNNALVVMATPREYTSILAALRELDTAPTQVFIEAAIAEVTLTDDLRYGIQYFFRDSDHQVALSEGTSFLVAPTLPGFAYSFAHGMNIRAVLDALSAVTHVEVVSSPKLMVLNNQTASLQVGDRVPIVTQQATSIVTEGAPIVNSVQYQDTGVILEVTPRVNHSGMVMMDITQEVSGVTSTTSSTINSPTIQQRTITSSVAVSDGETVALGGLISNTVRESETGIPLLMDIPAFGKLFSSTGEEISRTELIVLITPHVIDGVEKARSITEELRERLPAVQVLLDQAS